MFNLFRSAQIPTLKSIYICESAGKKLEAVSSISAIENQGLQGDRYQAKKGYWDPVEGCQITIITLHEIAHAQKRSQISLDHGEHRRNLVLANIHPKKLIGKTIQIGEAIFKYWKPRPPCGYLDQIVMKGTAKALGKGSGYCFMVVKGGRISVGDHVHLIS